MITHLSPSKYCKFIFPILEDVDLLIDYNGLFWRIETSKMDSLKDFSDACTGFILGVFEGNGNIFIVITKKEFMFEEHIELIFESRLQDDFPCAFFDENTNEYDDFLIPVDAQGISLSVDNNDHFVITSLDYDEEDIEEEMEEGDEAEYPPIPIYDSVIPVSDSTTNNTFDDEVNELKEHLNASVADNELLRDKICELEAERDSLLLRLKAKTSVSAQDADEATKAELERLKTLILQLVDRDYNGDFVQTANVQINELTQKIKKQKVAEKEKTASLERLKSEYDKAESKTKEISVDISHTMDLLHKAESIQRESITELSVFQKQLNDILTELQIDISTLEMYETQDSIDTLLLESNDMKNRIEAKLKVLISSRQKDSTSRFNNVTS
ncbi:hypothetical protein AALB81_16130 [Lachnospiraceae bacterium 48-33]